LKYSVKENELEAKLLSTVDTSEGIYEFKVLQLKMHWDFDDEKTCETRVDEEAVCELFNFTFPLSLGEF